jgi:hypothetical protein
MDRKGKKWFGTRKNGPEQEKMNRNEKNDPDQKNVSLSENFMSLRFLS